MKKCILVFVLGMTLFSCGPEKKVQLPQVTQVEVRDVIDHSPIYLFFEKEGKDTLVDLNKNNLIGTTNWIFNIDKRLALKQIVPELVYFLNKKRGRSMHKNDEAEMYFSCSDSIAQQLAFVPFTDVTFSEKIYHSTTYIKQYPEYHIPYHNVSITFGKKGKIIIDGNKLKVDEINKFINEFVVFASNKKPILFYLNFDESLSFDSYLKYKTLIQSLLTSNMQLSNTEFIYDANQLSLRCNCLK